MYSLVGELNRALVICKSCIRFKALPATIRLVEARCVIVSCYVYSIPEPHSYQIWEFPIKKFGTEPVL